MNAFSPCGTKVRLLFRKLNESMGNGVGVMVLFTTRCAIVSLRDWELQSIASVVGLLFGVGEQVQGAMSAASGHRHTKGEILVNKVFCVSPHFAPGKYVWYVTFATNQSTLPHDLAVQSMGTVIKITMKERECK